MDQFTQNPINQDLNSMSEQVEVMSQTHQNFGAASLMVPPPTTSAPAQPKSVSGLGKTARITINEKRDLETKHIELKNQLTSVQKENASIVDKSKQ